MARVTDGFVEVARPVPQLGRLFTPVELRTSSRVAIISHGLWREQFGGDPQTVGRSLTIDGTRYETIGVMREGFWFPHRGADAWIPFPADSPPDTSVTVAGRLAPGASMSAGAAEANVAALAHGVGRTGDSQPAVVAPATDEARIKAVPAGIGLIGPSTLVLFITWANAATLLLIGAAARQRDIAVRAALGASRARLVGESLACTAVATGIAGLLGAVAAYWLKAWLAHAVGIYVSPVASAPLEGGIPIVIAVALVIALLTIPAAGLIPAIATQTSCGRIFCS